MNLRELRPRGRRWMREKCVLPADGSRIAFSAWSNGKVYCISALNFAELPTGNGIGPQWHISISRYGKRPKNVHCERALKAFGVLRAEEDNHHPGMARHFWLPVDPKQRVECQCKTDETVIVDRDGYTWTNPKNGECRGCEFGAMFRKPCPVHGGAL